MEIEQLQKQLETEKNVGFRGECHDCGVPVEVLCGIDENGKIVISGGAIYNPKVGIPPVEQRFFKCDKCFKKKRTLTDFVICEVFSRVVGYIRPVTQWNKGKIEEFKQRKEFVVEGK